MKIFYKGISFKRWRSNASTLVVTDIELVKQDLLNHIFTEKGTRVMMPEWGTRIPVLTFEQNDEYCRAIVEEDLNMVFKSDPRVKLLNMEINSLSSNNAIIAIATLQYVEFDVVEDLNIEVRLK